MRIKTLKVDFSLMVVKANIEGYMGIAVRIFCNWHIWCSLPGGQLDGRVLTGPTLWTTRASPRPCSVPLDPDPGVSHPSVSSLLRSWVNLSPWPERPGDQ